MNSANASWKENGTLQRVNVPCFPAFHRRQLLESACDVLDDQSFGISFATTLVDGEARCLGAAAIASEGARRIHKLHVLKEKVGVTETLLPFLTGEGFLALPFETFLICAKKRPY